MDRYALVGSDKTLPYANQQFKRTRAANLSGEEYKMSRHSKTLFCIVVICTLSLIPLLGHANVVKYYKYSSTDEKGDTYFFGEVANADQQKRYFFVEYDDAGRILRHALHINGKKSWENIRKYSGASNYYHEVLELSPKGDKESSVKIQRNENGAILKKEEYDKDGKLVTYSTWKPSTSFWNSDKSQIEYKSYTPNGELKNESTGFYEKGRLIKIKSQRSSCQSSINYYNTETGRIKSSDNNYCNGSFTQWNNFYDSAGLLIKKEGHDRGKIYSIQEFQDELMVKDESWKNEGHAVKTLIYDENRQSKSAEFYMNDRFVCRFEYERQSTGTVKRTVAYDKEGNILAEYPDREVLHIYANGESIDNRKCIIYKRGNFF